MCLFVHVVGSWKSVSYAFNRLLEESVCVVCRSANMLMFLSQTSSAPSFQEGSLVVFDGLARGFVAVAGCLIRVRVTVL